MADPEASRVPDPLATVDLAAVADSHGIGHESLRQTLIRMQTDVRSYPGIADIVYEYRRAFPRDPLVARVEDCYYLLVPSNVWPEFAAALGIDDATLAALKTVHARAFDDSAAAGPEARPDNDREPLLLVG